MAGYPPPDQYQASLGVPAGGQWSTGICGCCEDMESCCVGCWVPCILVGRSIEIIDQGATSCLMGAAIWTAIECFTGCGCLYTWNYRTRLRHKFGLPEAPCNDCLTECCCAFCSICQVSRELKFRNMTPATFGTGQVSYQTGPPQGQYMSK